MSIRGGSPWVKTYMGGKKAVFEKGESIIGMLNCLRELKSGDSGKL